MEPATIGGIVVVFIVVFIAVISSRKKNRDRET
jgi:hypothetical protein